MSRTQTNKRQSTALDPSAVEDALASIEAGKPVRFDLDGGRLHIDRAQPFLCVYIGHDANAAFDVASANASYLIASDLEFAVPIVEAIAGVMEKRFAAFLLLDVGEFAEDRFLSDDTPYLPPFEITVSATDETATQAALDGFAVGVEGVEAKFRSPRLGKLRAVDDPHARLAARVAGIPCVTVRFAPIYRIPESDDVYPALRESMVANIFDAGLQAVAAFLKAQDIFSLPTHRALGRRAFVDAVERADRAIDEIATTFDFLLAVTPINADAAWMEFKSKGYQLPPRFLYRPLTVQAEAEKRKLFSISFERFEDPVLFHLYREKQQELDLQLSMLSARETPRFVEFGRALYGRVEPDLLLAAREILIKTVSRRAAVTRESRRDESVDCYAIEREARAMIEMYRRQYSGFRATVELRDDLPPGLVVSGARLLISRRTNITQQRLIALLSHEVGVHLLTYFNGSAQGLRLFRTGLAGYEGVQEGLAVLAEYLAGGMTTARLRLIAARVVACAAMLDGASFLEIFHSLVREHGFAKDSAFNLTLRLCRGGGLAKDAIYLRGLLEVLQHLRNGGALDPLWMGKISASHFAVMQELNSRGLLREPQLRPAFLAHPQALERLEKARNGLAPIEMIANP